MSSRSISSESESSSETSSSSESDTESEVIKPKRRHQSRIDSKKEDKQQEEKVSTIRLPRYKVYKGDAPGKEVVIELSEKFENKPKKSSKNQKKHRDEDAFSLNEIKSASPRKRSKSRESRHSRHSSRHSVRNSKSTKDIRY